jgi:hypothetical protein
MRSAPREICRECDARAVRGEIEVSVRERARERGIELGLTAAVDRCAGQRMPIAPAGEKHDPIPMQEPAGVRCGALDARETLRLPCAGKRGATHAAVVAARKINMVIAGKGRAIEIALGQGAFLAVARDQHRRLVGMLRDDEQQCAVGGLGHGAHRRRRAPKRAGVRHPSNPAS